MKQLVLLFSCLAFSTLHAQDSVHVEALPLYFEQVFTFVEQLPEFKGGDEEFRKVLNNNITFPKSLKNEKKADANVKGYDNGITLKVACLIDIEGKVLHVQCTEKSNTTIPEKDKYSIENQIAYLLVNHTKPLFKPAKLNGQKTYCVYENEVVLRYSATQKPQADFLVKPTKEFYKKPAVVHFMSTPPACGSNTDVDINKLLRDNVKMPAILSGYSFSGTVAMYIDENGVVNRFTFQQHTLLKYGKPIELKRGTAEYFAYNQLGEAIQVYLAKLKGWKPGTVGGYNTYSRLTLPVCIGPDCK